MISIKKINNEIVHPVKYIDEEEDNRPIRGYQLFTELTPNVFCLAKKKSGKSSVVYKIVKGCATTDTTVIVFCSTVDKDKVHKSIRAYCKSKHIPYMKYTSMKEDGIDILDALVKDLQEKAKIDEESESEEEPKKLVLFESSDEEEDKPRKRNIKHQNI